MRTLVVTLAGFATLVATPALAADYLVLASPGKLASAKAAATAAGGTLGTDLSAIDAFTVSSTSSSFAAKLSKDKSVFDLGLNATIGLAAPTHSYSVSAKAVADAESVDPSDDFLAGAQWSLDAVSADAAWAEGYTGAGVRVCVLDSGMYKDHGDLAGQIDESSSASFVPGESWDYVESGNHGTHVGGIIAAADNAYGTVGIAPGAELVAVKVLSASTGSGSFGGVIAGVIYSADVGCDIGNMSLSGSFFKNGRDAAFLKNAMTRASKYAESKGMLVVAAAANDSVDYDHAANYIVAPAGIPGVVAVSALGPLGWATDSSTDLDVQAFYTNYGTSLIHQSGPGGNVDLDAYAAWAADPQNPDHFCVAGGVGGPCWAFDMVLSPVPGVIPGVGTVDGWQWSAGTSMASPAASAVAALACEMLGSSCSPKELRKILKHTSDDLGKPGADPIHGHGRVNAYEAVQ
jgi:subtilisin family serine protease